VRVLDPPIVVFVASSSIVGSGHGWTDPPLVRPETSVTRIDPRGAPRWPSTVTRSRSGAPAISVVLSVTFISLAIVQRSTCSPPAGAPAARGYVLRPPPCTLHVAGHVK
jgi:hypothetical protein